MHALETVAAVLTTITLTGMRTVHCVRAVRTALMALDAVDRADVQVNHVVLEHGRPIPHDTIVAAIAATPYHPESITTDARSLPVV